MPDKLSKNGYLAPYNSSHGFHFKNTDQWLNEIYEAYKAISKICVKTDVRKLSWLQRIAGIDAVGKFENQQRTGSFKFRGAYNRLRHQDHSRNIIAASAGNHGLAIAEAAKLLELNATICIPTTASPLKRNRLAAYEHSIVPMGAQLEEATTYAKNIAKKMIGILFLLIMIRESYRGKPVSLWNFWNRSPT